MNMFARFDKNPANDFKILRKQNVMDGRRDVRPILNIGPVYKGPLIRGQVSEITGQFSTELAR